MKVIGVGLPRTATLTQKIALERLGFGPCYHMTTVLADLDRVEHWRKAFDGSPDWDEAFAGFESSMDWPAGFFYRELIETYPQAKVVLSVRDPEAWARSTTSTVWDIRFGDSLLRHLSDARALIEPRWNAYNQLMTDLMWSQRAPLHAGAKDPSRLPELLERYNEQVEADVPAERLLVWDVSAGWEPLCEFLGVDVPDAPMPRANDSGTFFARVIDASLAKLEEWWAAEKAEAVPAAH